MKISHRQTNEGESIQTKLKTLSMLEKIETKLTSWLQRELKLSPYVPLNFSNLRGDKNISNLKS